MAADLPQDLDDPGVKELEKLKGLQNLAQPVQTPDIEALEGRPFFLP